MRRAAKIDANQTAVVNALRKFGCAVQSLAAIGAGCPDLLVGYRGQNILMEVKDGSKCPSARQLTILQHAWHRAWPNKVHVVESVDQALEIVKGK